MSVKNSKTVKIPKRFLGPVGDFLRRELSRLERRKRQVESDDPFKDEGRLEDNASPDADAAEQFGHAKTSAVKNQLDRRIIQTRKALARVKIGRYGICEECGKMIDTDRLIAYPEATRCLDCEKKRER